MGMTVFDWNSFGFTKMVLNTSLSELFLFDGYLTGLISYQQIDSAYYLTGNIFLSQKRS